MEEKLENYIDTQGAMLRVRGNAKLFKSLLNVFLHDPHFNQLLLQVGRGEYEAAAHTAHAIKGVAANLALTEVFELSRILEGMLRAGDDVSDFIDNYKSEFLKTCSCIESILKTL